MAKDKTNPYSMSFDEDGVADGVLAVTVRKRVGDDFEDLETETFKLEDVAEELLPNISLYGLKQIISDRCSQVETGPDKLSAMREVMALLGAGQWKKERVVGAPTVSPEVEALAELKEISIPDAQRALKGYAPEQREKILGNPRIKEMAAKIREQRASAETVSLDDLAAA